MTAAASRSSRTSMRDRLGRTRRARLRRLLELRGCARQVPVDAAGERGAAPRTPRPEEPASSAEGRDECLPRPSLGIKPPRKTAAAPSRSRNAATSSASAGRRRRAPRRRTTTRHRAARARWCFSIGYRANATAVVAASAAHGRHLRSEGLLDRPTPGERAAPAVDAGLPRRRGADHCGASVSMSRLGPRGQHCRRVEGDGNGRREMGPVLVAASIADVSKVTATGAGKWAQSWSQPALPTVGR